MSSNLFMYLTAMSAVSIHNLVSNIKEATHNVHSIDLPTSAANWSLEANISTIFPHCNGPHQSPINIEPNKTAENLDLRLGLTAYDKPISGFLVNQFPTFQLVPLSMRWPRPSALVSTSTARAFNPFADSHFTLNYVQFYWSRDDQNSSLHRIDGDSYPVEMHFVHVNTAYASLDEAYKKPDGLLILAVMAVPSTHESYVFERLLNELAGLDSPGRQSPIEEDSTWRSLLPADTSRFYRYQGSLVLPPCHESVQWIVFEDKLRLGYRQLKRLRRFRFVAPDLRQAGAEVDWSSQRRLAQPLNGRPVERSFGSRPTKGRARRT